MRMGRLLCWPRSQKWPYFSYPLARWLASELAVTNDIRASLYEQNASTLITNARTLKRAERKGTTQ
jgi:hypothetical protein